GEPREVTGPDSFRDGAGLEPDKILAPLLNGVPREQGKGIVEFEIRNGTREEVYVTLGYEQPLPEYTKSWIIAYGLVSETSVPYACWDTSQCAPWLGLPCCVLEWPMSLQPIV